MRIAFVTTCLQPARDGVGDYTACLAEECARLGNEVFQIALNDPYLKENVIDGRCVRLSACLPWQERFDQAAQALARFAPDVISLQFVCYGFHPRGFGWGLAGRLKSLFGSVPVQITFHELWIGAESGAGLKDRVVGRIQRRGVVSLVHRLRPVLVHTTNPAYLALLAQNAIIARRLPLFGSVPADGYPLMDRVNGRVDPGWSFGMFGSLHPVWPPEPLLKRLLATGRKIAITHVGNIGQGGELWERMKREYGSRIAFERLGQVPTAGVAGLFARTDFGIATTPWELIGKSASVAAMLEHGMPVVVNRDDVHFRGWTAEGYSPLLIKMGEDLGDCLENARHQTPRSIRAEVAEQFLEDLVRAGLAVVRAGQAVGPSRTGGGPSRTGGDRSPTGGDPSRTGDIIL